MHTCISLHFNKTTRYFLLSLSLTHTLYHSLSHTRSSHHLYSLSLAPSLARSIAHARALPKYMYMHRCTDVSHSRQPIRRTHLSVPAHGGQKHEQSWLPLRYQGGHAYWHCAARPAGLLVPVCVCLHAHTSIHVYMCVCVTHMCVRVCVCVCACFWVCVHLCVCICARG